MNFKKEKIYKNIDNEYLVKDGVEKYDKVRFESEGGILLHRLEIETVLSFIRDRDKSNILDLGCGTGRISLHLAQNRHFVTSVDYSLEMLKKLLLKKAKSKLENIQCINGNIFQLPFKDNFFDIVVSMHVLMHLPEHEKALKEFIRVLKPGGLLIFDIRNKLSFHHLFYPLRILKKIFEGKDPWYVWYSNIKEIENLAFKNQCYLSNSIGRLIIKPNQRHRIFVYLLEKLEKLGPKNWYRNFGHLILIKLRKMN